MDTFAICMTASRGAHICFSSVASVALDGDFESLYDRYKKGDINTSTLKQVNISIL